MNSETQRIIAEHVLSGWVVEGAVLRSSDTGNALIVEGGKTRMLVLPEHQELMTPTMPCFQTGAAKAIESIFPDRP